ncbi:hypothetical protein BC830DRAFT_1158110, partial [Chytriomyces sp. MP71]
MSIDLLFKRRFSRVAIAPLPSTTEHPKANEASGEENPGAGHSVWDKLPVEVRLRILGFVGSGGRDLAALATAARVSRDWNSLANSGDVLVCVEMNRSFSADKVMILGALVTRSKGFLRQLDLRGLLPPSSIASHKTQIDSAVIRSIVHNCPNIQYLNLARCNFLSTSQVLALLRDLPHLTHVNLCGLRAVCDMTLDILSRPGRLVSLDVSYCPRVTDKGISFIVDRCQDMACFLLSGVNAATDLILSNMSRLAHLEALDISESDNITDIGLQHTFLSLKTHHTSLVPPLTHTDQDFHLPPPSLKLTPTLHKLISLNLSNSPAAITDTLLTILAWSTPNLHDIVLRNSAHITDMGVSRLAEGCTLLEHVDVGGCARVGLASFEALGLCCGRTLRVLRAPFCPRVTDECLRALLSLCTRLRVLSVDDCPRVSDAFLEALAADPVPSLEVVEVRDCARVTMRAVRDALARVNRP